MTNLPAVQNIKWIIEPASNSRTLLQTLANRIDEAFTKATNKEDLLGDAEGALGIGGLVEERSALFRGVILYKVRERWDELPLRDPSFENWAVKAAGRDIRTLNNWARVAEVFVLLPPQKIPADFNPEEVMHSKLLVAAHAASDGELSREDWDALKDPDVSHRDFVERLHGPREEKPKLPANNHYFKRDGHLVLYVEGTGEIFDFIEFDPLITDGPRYKAMVAVLEFLR